MNINKCALFNKIKGFKYWSCDLMAEVAIT